VPRRPPLILIREYAVPGSAEDREARLALGRLLLAHVREHAPQPPAVPARVMPTP